MLTPAIRAIRFLSASSTGVGFAEKIPRDPTPISTLHGPGSKRKSRRAHERAAGQPVDRDEREIGFAHRRVKAPALQSSPIFAVTERLWCRAIDSIRGRASADRRNPTFPA